MAEVTTKNLKEVLAVSILKTEEVKQALVQDLKETNDKIEEEAGERRQADDELAGHINTLQESFETLDDKKADREEVEERIKTIELTPGPKGDSYIITDKDKKEIAKGIVVPVVEKVIERVEVIKELPIITNEIREVAVKDTAKELRDKLETLSGKDRLSKEAIDGLTEDLQDIRNHAFISKQPGWGAHPLVIKDEGEVIDKVARTINFTGQDISAERQPDGTIDVTVKNGDWISETDSVDFPNSLKQAHGAVKVNNKFYLGLRDSGSIIVYNNPDNNLSNTTVLTIPGGHVGVESMIYDATTDRIYFTITGLSASPVSARIGTLDPDDNSISVSSALGSWGGSPAITSDGTYIYATTYTSPATFVKVRISDMTVVASATWTGRTNGHAAAIATYIPSGEFDPVTRVICTNAEASVYLAIVDPDDLSFTEVAVPGVNVATDDLLITEVSSTTYAIVGGEFADMGAVVSLNDETVYNFYVPRVYGFGEAAPYFYALGYGGHVVQYRLTDLPSGVLVGTWYATTYSPNEFFCSDDDKLFFTHWSGTGGKLVEFTLPTAKSLGDLNDTLWSSVDIRADRFYATPLGSGLEPYGTTSTTLNTNLNADLLDGNHASAFQPIDADLTAIAALSGTSGFLKKTAANTWALDTSAFITLASLSGTSPITYNSGTGAIGFDLSVANTFTGAQKINVNSTTAFFVEQNGVKDDTFIVDTTNGAVGINGAAVSGQSLTIGGTDATGLRIQRTQASRATMVDLLVGGTYSWSGAGLSQSIGSLSLGIVDNRTLNSGITDSQTLNGFTLSHNKTTNTNSTIVNVINNNVNENATYNKGTAQSTTIRGMVQGMNISPVITGGQTVTGNYYCNEANVSGGPTLTSGDALIRYQGFRSIGTLTSLGSDTRGASFYSSASGGDSFFAFHNDSVQNNYLGADNSKSYFGTGGNTPGSFTNGIGDASIYFDATDFHINPREIGTGNLKVNSDIWPTADNTYYLGKNDDDTPFAWKGVILKDTTNGKYYRIEVVSGVVTATDLTD